jgi:hypothetical protein
MGIVSRRAGVPPYFGSISAAGSAAGSGTAARASTALFAAAGGQRPLRVGTEVAHDHSTSAAATAHTPTLRYQRMALAALLLLRLLLHYTKCGAADAPTTPRARAPRRD